MARKTPEMAALERVEPFGAVPKPGNKSTGKPAVSDGPTVWACPVRGCGQSGDGSTALVKHHDAHLSELAELVAMLEDMRHPDNGRHMIAQCGSPSGYRRHFRKGEAPCPACRRAESEKARSRMANPERRERRRAREGLRMADPEYRERKNARERASRAKIMADPEKRERRNAQNRASAERARTDPEKRERKNAKQRARYAAKRSAAPGALGVKLGHEPGEAGVEQ